MFADHLRERSSTCVLLTARASLAGSPPATMRLLNALRSAGVDNLDTYAVELQDLVSGEAHKDFVAFNIVGKIAGADRARTKFDPNERERMISADIDSLVVNEQKTHGALMLSLAESVNAIVVHASVLATGIETLTFLEPEDWAG